MRPDLVLSQSLFWRKAAQGLHQLRGWRIYEAVPFLATGKLDLRRVKETAQRLASAVAALPSEPGP